MDYLLNFYTFDIAVNHLENYGLTLHLLYRQIYLFVEKNDSCIKLIHKILFQKRYIRVTIRKAKYL